MLLTIYNVSKQHISSVYFEIICFDDAGDPVKLDGSNIIKYAYMDLDIKPTDFFGSDKYIELTGPTVRNVDIKLVKAVYTNGDVYRVSEHTTPISIPQLSSIDTLEESLKDHLFNEVFPSLSIEKKKVRFFPEVIGEDIWACCCGRLNRIEETSCTRCGLKKDIVFKTINNEAVSSSYEAHIRKLAEKEKTLEEERQKQLVYRKQKRTKSIRIIIAMIIVVSTIGASMPSFIKEVHYKQAISLASKGEYEEALNVLAKLNYDDNRIYEMENDIKYQAGKEALINRDFSNAYRFLSSLDYRDAKDLLKKAYYEEAKDYYKKYKADSKIEDIRSAHKLITNVGEEYTDAGKLLVEYKDELNDAIYREAIKLFNQKYFVEARELFNEIEHYKDTREYLDSEYYKIEGRWRRYDTNYYFVLDTEGRIRRVNENKDKYGYTEGYRSYAYYWSQAGDFVFSSYEITFVDDSIGGKLILNGREEYKFIGKDITLAIEKIREQEAKVKPVIGMIKYEVRNSTWGEPIDINRTITGYGIHEQWVYSNNRYIYFENGIMTAIQD